MASPPATAIGNKDRRSNISRGYYLFLLLSPFHLYYLPVLSAQHSTAYFYYNLTPPTYIYIYLYLFSQPSRPRYSIAKIERISAVGLRSLLQLLAAALARTSSRGGGLQKLSFRPTNTVFVQPRFTSFYFDQISTKALRALQSIHTLSSLSNFFTIRTSTVQSELLG